MPLPIRRSMRGTSTLFASCPIAPSGTDVPICLISEITSTGFGSRLLTSKVEGGELLFASRGTDPLFIPQIAACVRLDPDLAKDRLDVDHHGRLGDVDLSRYT